MCGATDKSIFDELIRQLLTPNPNQFNRPTQAIMIKPIKTAGIAMLLGVIVLPIAQAQTPAQNAAQEVVRRQAAIIELRNKLKEAGTVEQSGNNVAAAILYEEAQKRVESIGIGAKGIDAESAATIEGLTRVRLALGEKLSLIHI